MNGGILTLRSMPTLFQRNNSHGIRILPTGLAILTGILVRSQYSTTTIQETDSHGTKKLQVQGLSKTVASRFPFLGVFDAFINIEYNGLAYAHINC